MNYNFILRSKRLNAAGFTLIEISVVIALILGLIVVVFLGLGSYREGANQVTCRMQLTAVQKAIRSYANLTNLKITDPLPESTVVFGGTPPVLAVKPVCPAGGLYTWQTTVPAIGVPYGDCTGTTPVHTLAGTVAEW